MEKRRHFFRDLVQGVLSCLLLWYIMCSERSRLPSRRWVKVVPKGFMRTKAFCLVCMAILFIIEGTKMADRSRKGKVSPVRNVLDVYIGYWKVVVPLTALGYAFFSTVQDSRVYTPMFLHPTFLNISRALLALTNNLHEGAWLVSCVAICAFFSSLYVQLRERGKKYAPLMPVVAVAVVGVLYYVIIPFRYHRPVYRAATVIGTVGYMAAFLLWPRARDIWAKGLERAEGLAGNRVLSAVTAPFRYVGRNWVGFWIVEFFVAYYHYNLPASVYKATGSTLYSFLIFVAVSAFLLFAINWTCHEFVRAWKASKWSVLSMILLLALPFVLHFLLEASTDYGVYVQNTTLQWPFHVVISWIGIMCVIMLMRALTGRWHVAGIVTTVLFTVIGVANYFTMKYHGTLLTVEDLKNIETAANVAGGYDFSIDATSGRVLLFGLAGLACCLLAWFAFRKARPAFVKGGRWATRGVCLVASIGVFYMVYLAGVPLEAKSNNLWNWVILYSKIGYFNGTVESTRANFSFTVRKPANYTDERVAELVEQAKARIEAQQAIGATEAEDLPDIVMILNETWYDLDDYMVTNADVDYMKNYNALENAIKGRVVVPLNGGGTNSTEYEALTGNSSSLINAYSPYNRLDFSHQVALPTYLREYGYSSVAAHPLYAQNYLRGLRWRQLRFDAMHFIEDFTDREYYGARGGEFDRCTDVSAIRNMIRFYNELPEDQPRLGFLITIQNHGGWYSNPPELALVHSSFATEDPGLINQVNEFLSCMSLTDEAITYLQQYYTELYETAGRRVIVCMFGDHCPKLISSLREFYRYEDDDDRKILEKSTPYFIWANYPLSEEQLNLPGTDNMDLCYLMPTVLEVAGVPLSYYYQHIVDMREDVAVFTNVDAGYAGKESDTLFRDREGNTHNIDEGGPLAQKVIDYYCMEYNLSYDEKSQEPALFWPDGIDPDEEEEQ